MKKLPVISLSILVLSILIMPTIAMAAWWNPFSWFKKREVLQQPSAQVQKTTSTNYGIPTKNVVSVGIQNTSTSKIDYGSPALNKLLGGSSPKGVAAITTTESPDITNERENLISLLQDQIAAFQKQQAVETIIGGSIKSKISSLNDVIANDQGIEIGNPDYATVGKYLDGLTQNQIDFENKYFSAESGAVSWLQSAQADQQTTLSQLPTLTTKVQLDAVTANYQSYKDNLQKVMDSSDSWAQAADQLDAKVLGITEGLDGKYKADLSTLPLVVLGLMQNWTND